MMPWKYLLIIPVALLLFAAVIGVEILLARRGPQLDFRNPAHEPIKMGKGTPLTYVVLGDSTTAGEGASSYKTGIAETTARYLARNHTVTYINMSIAGARARDVEEKQVATAASYKPDVVLISVGANDATHNASPGSVRKSTQTIIDKLVAANCKVKVVLTGVPEMGAIPRLPQPLRWLAGAKGHSLNTMFIALSTKNHVTFAPIGEKTGPLFKKDASLFAADKYHPNDRGYLTWIPVLEPALDEALSHQPDHC